MCVEAHFRIFFSIEFFIVNQLVSLSGVFFCPLSMLRDFFQGI